ncbi:EGF-like calcium-binding [Cynara cardunculus var. scolymus]|uniref:EGF-like calcium-binding n=1 Tax=Cynara cardunculus var. scolymus TaxID=59895 RepID=A0A103XXB8_CYNCS|nr:EGF-like calcium-binding [Cynara cardunculus var. scolymus]
MLLLIFIILHLFSPAATTVNNITLPGCTSKCGNLTVPYPFGIGSNSGCSIGPWFDISCNTSFDPPKAFLPENLFSYTGSSNIQRLEIVGISDEHVRVKNTVAFKCYSQIGEIIDERPTGLVVVSSYFTLSELNKLIAVGCDDYSFISPVAGIEGKNFSSGCGASDFTDPDFVNRTEETVPVVLNWVIGTRSCNEYKNTSDYYCQQNSICVDFEGGNGGYRCSCNNGYQGNPYLPPGCNDIDECADPNNNPCDGICSNLPGSFNCSCPHGYEGDGRKDGNGCTVRNSRSPFLKLSVGE